MQSGFEEKTSRLRHSTGNDFRLTLTPTYLKMTSDPEAVMTLKQITGKTQTADTGLTLHNPDLLQM
jgi:hypothetical protein